MSYINQLFVQMEQRLSAQQLEALITYINERPYKREGRAPTRAEQEEVIAAIENALLDAPETEENTGLQRLKNTGELDNFPDTDF